MDNSTAARTTVPNKDAVKPSKTSAATDVPKKDAVKPIVTATGTDVPIKEEVKPGGTSTTTVFPKKDAVKPSETVAATAVAKKDAVKPGGTSTTTVVPKKDAVKPSETTTGTDVPIKVEVKPGGTSTTTVVPKKDAVKPCETTTGTDVPIKEEVKPGGTSTTTVVPKKDAVKPSETTTGTDVPIKVEVKPGGTSTTTVVPKKDAVKPRETTTGTDVPIKEEVKPGGTSTTTVVPKKDAVKPSETTTGTDVPIKDAVKPSGTSTTTAVPKKDAVKPSEMSAATAVPKKEALKPGETSTTIVVPKKDAVIPSETATTTALPKKDAVKPSETAAATAVPKKETVKPSQTATSTVVPKKNAVIPNETATTTALPIKDTVINSETATTTVVPNQDSVKPSKTATSTVVPKKDAVIPSETATTTALPIKDTVINSETATTTAVPNQDAVKPSETATVKAIAVKSDETSITESPVVSSNTDKSIKNTTVTENTTASNYISEKLPEQINAVIMGTCSMDKLPPLPKKIVRIFFSSTFTDTKEERNALMQYVYPQLSQFCRDKHGLEFQVVDMRWGVPEQASDNHSTSELCIQEIKKCQQVSVGPNFVAIVGDKYGYRPIPSAISEQLFTKLKQAQSTIQGSDWPLLEEWYRKDENALPTVYILQPISSKIEHYNDNSNPELNKQARDKWNTVNQSLTNTLRNAAEKAYNENNLSEVEKQMFFMSVTENEIQEGLFEQRSNPTESCFCIIRKILDLPSNLSDIKAPRFADIKEQQFDQQAKTLLEKLRDNKLMQYIPESNISKLEIEWHASGAKLSLDKFRDIDVAKYVQQALQYEEKNVLKYKNYLENVCTTFFNKISKLIDEGGTKEKQLYNELTAEILQHWHLAKLRCEIFEGRDDILSKVKTYLDDMSTRPYAIHGNSGCGKTSVMAKIMENLAGGNWKSESNKRFMMVSRFLGTTPNTSNVHQLIVTLCQQISIMYETEWEEPEKFSELVKSFHALLGNATKEKPILVLLDSVDQLMPAYNAFKLGWLPQQLPANVKLIISTIDDGYSILKNCQERYGSDLKQSEVKPLGEKLGLEVIRKWLTKDNRTMTEQQTNVIKLALRQCSLPLYARIAYDHIRKWKSYDTPDIKDLEPTVRGAINKLFESLEEKFGIDIVKHSLAYLTASRYGLSEAELEHILSLDDILLNEIFKIWNPPIRRIPPLLWTRIRTEIHSYLVERSADDTLVLYWYHRQFIEATKLRYLKDQNFSKHIHNILIEYFTGKWGGGKEKTFQYTEAQMKRFGLSSPSSKADRKVPLQPYIIRGSDNEIRYNKRKLSELPFHLIKCKEYKELKRLVFFNYEWLYGKLCSSSPQQMLEEFEIFMQADKIMKKDAEMKNLYANLQLIRSYIARYPNSLAYELTGRMAKYLGQSDAIACLIQGCDAIGIEQCLIVPLITSFETADVSLTQNITFRKSEPYQEGGAFTCSPDFKFMYIIDYNDSVMPVVHIWDIASAEKINTLTINKTKDEQTKSAQDVYIQLELSKNGKFLLGFYKQKYVGDYTHRYRDHGLVDLIDVESGNVTRTYEGFLYREEYYNPLHYFTENYLCVRFGWKVPLYNMTEDTKKDINRPTLLSTDERFFILCGQKKTELKEFKTNEVVGEFDVSETQLAIAATEDFSIVAMMGSETKQLKIFDLGKKQLHANKKYGYLLKYKKQFDLEPKVASTVADLFKPVIKTNNKGEQQEKTNNRVIMSVAADNRHLLVVFRGTEEWMGFVWNMGRWNAKFVGSVTERMALVGRFPMFNHDGTCVAYAKDKEILIHSTEDASQINKFEMAETVKDFYMSQHSNKIAVMQQKSVVLLNITKSDAVMSTSSRVKKNVLNEKSSILLEREINTSFIHKDVIISPSADGVEVEELLDIGLAASTDRLASARSKVRYAIEKCLTPDGLKAVHYHTRTQIIDTKADEIKYTPKKGELIIRVAKTATGTAGTENVKIPGLEPGEKGPRILDLIQGDRIVNENNKVKFRVNQEPNGHFKIMNVPSIITIYSAEEEKLRQLQRFTVYQENILTVGNRFIVTAKRTGVGNFIKVYELGTGKELATHEVTSGCDCSKFSLDEVQLIVVDKSLTVRVYLSPSYNSLEQKVALQSGEVNAAFVVKDILCFRNNHDFIVVKFGPEGDSLSVRSRYIGVNISTKDKSAVMEMNPTFEDISKDGKIGVDGRLCVYNMQTGTITNTIAYAGIKKSTSNDKSTETMQLRVRISEDSKYIVYVDKHDDTLHIAQVLNNTYSHLLSCHTHNPHISLSHGLELRYHGRMIVIRTEATITPFVIRDVQKETEKISYESEILRALSLVDSAWAVVTQKPLPNVERLEANKMFVKKYALRAPEEEETTEQIEDDEEKDKINKVKSTVKPSVLIMAESIFSQFKPSRFTAHLSTQLVMVFSADEAVKKLKALSNTYDAIVLQLISDDVKHFDAKTCIEKVCSAVEFAKKNAWIVVISLAPHRADNQELNQKTEEINQKVKAQTADSKTVFFCDNSNMSENGKPLHKYFKDGVNLSPFGIQLIATNIKTVLQGALELDII